MNLEECFAKRLLVRVTKDAENASRSLQISRDYLADAARNNEIGCYKVVLILCYTSMFHAARALLFRDGVKERSHLCIPVYVRAQYPDLERLANLLDSYRELRHGVFYRMGISVDEGEAAEALRSARGFLSRIETIVGV